jgi:hypothetical protein
MTTASLRAKATLAFFMPALQATLAAQLLSCDPLTGLVRMMLAASLKCSARFLIAALGYAACDVGLA